MPEGRTAGLLQLHRDVPNRWDAWDIDRTYQRTDDRPASRRSSVERDRAAGCGVERQLRRLVARPDASGSRRTRPGSTSASPSTGTSGRSCSSWRSRSTCTPTARPRRSSSATSTGRPTPTPRGTARGSRPSRTAGSTWASRATASRSSNDSTYGHDITRTSCRRPGQRPRTSRLSLLRAPLFPDPDADQGEHVLNVSVAVGAGIPEAVAEGYRRNLPLRVVDGVGDDPVEPLVARRPARRSSSRRSSSPRTAAATWSCGSTRRTGPGRGVG